MKATNHSLRYVMFEIEHLVKCGRLCMGLQDLWELSERVVPPAPERPQGAGQAGSVRALVPASPQRLPTPDLGARGCLVERSRAGRGRVPAAGAARLTAPARLVYRPLLYRRPGSGGAARARTAGVSGRGSR